MRFPAAFLAANRTTSIVYSFVFGRHFCECFIFLKQIRLWPITRRRFVRSGSFFFRTSSHRFNFLSTFLSIYPPICSLSYWIYVNWLLDACSAVFILALIITIALLISRSGDVDELEESPNENPARVLNSSEFLTLMKSNPFPIEGKTIAPNHFHAIVIDTSETLRQHNFVFRDLQMSYPQLGYWRSQVRTIEKRQLTMASLRWAIASSTKKLCRLYRWIHPRTAINGLLVQRPRPGS